MTTREYLQRPETLRLEIRRKRARISTLRRLSNRLSSVFSDVKVKRLIHATSVESNGCKDYEKPYKATICYKKHKRVIKKHRGRGCLVVIIILAVIGRRQRRGFISI